MFCLVSNLCFFRLICIICVPKLNLKSKYYEPQKNLLVFHLDYIF